MSPDRQAKTNPDNYLAHIGNRSGLPTDSIRSFLNQPFDAAVDSSQIPYGDDFVSKLRQACRSLGYEPANPLWRARLYPEKAAITVLLSSSIINGLKNAYFGSIIQALTESATEEGIPIRYEAFDHQRDYAEKGASLPEKVTDGLSNKYVLAGRTNPSLVEYLMNRDACLVFLSRASGIPGTTSVVPDYRSAASQAIQMLYAHGHRSIAVVGAVYCRENGYNVRELKAGAIAAAENLDISLSDSDIFFAEDFTVAERPNFINSVRNSPKGYTAVFCLDDNIAESLYKAAELVHLRIPDDLSVVGCNDQMDATRLTPMLSTVHIPVYRMGQQVLEEAMEMTRYGRPEGEKLVVLPTTPTLRASISFV